MKLTKIFTTAIALILLTTGANAGTTAVNFVWSPAEAAGPGFVSTDILIDFEGNLRGQQLYIQLDQDIYNNATFGADTAPNPALIGVDASVEFDSFVTIGGLRSDSSEGVLVVGGAVDIPGAPAELSLAGNVVSIAWAPSTGTDVPNGTNYPVARITLPSDASGTAWFFSSTSGTDPPLVLSDIPIAGGQIGIPEPSTLMLVGMGLIGFVGRRRRS